MILLRDRGIRVEAWDAFATIDGGAAAALTGLYVLVVPVLTLWSAVSSVPGCF